MRVSQKSILAVLCLVVFPTVFLFSEGTKQVMPNANAKGQLCINKFRSEFAFYGAPADFRLHISIASTSETIRFGFGQLVGPYTSGLNYRIKNASDVIVLDNQVVPKSGTGFIKTYEESVIGPFPLSAGYDYLEFHPQTTGNFYIEFFYPSPYSDDTRVELEFFDITVLNATEGPVNGRVWSKAWQFWGENPTAPPTSNRFYGKMMILSDDSIVTQVDCNGFIGGTFSISSNMNGCDNTGNLITDRKSRLGPITYPQYKIFLNDPDSLLFPTQKVHSGILLPIIPATNCSNGSAEFGVKVIKDGTIRLLIEINPSPGADPEDVQIIANVKAVPDFSEYNIIPWDGNDGLGKPVTSGTNISFSVSNLSGMTHLPLYDIEYNDIGFIVKQIRPAGGQLKIYWDDVSIGGSSNTATGCTNATGCHTWDYGNNNTINSWWFVTGSEFVNSFFISKKSPAQPVISGKNVHCVGTTGSLEFTLANDPNSTNYFWSYSGTGVTITETGTKATLNFAANATAGTLTVYGNNIGCGNGPESSMEIIFEALPVVVSPSFADLCYTAPAFSLTGGEPQGGTYFLHTMETDSIFPYKEPEGWLPIEYAYTSPTGCSNSDTSGILLISGADCLGAVYFPNAFTPDGDSLNDEFRPVVRNISSFKMYIFSRWGQLVFSTDDVTKGWNGKYEGKNCPGGSYTFTSTYGLSLREDTFYTKRGMFTLVR